MAREARLILGAILILLAAGRARADWAEVASLYGQARYDEAAQLCDSLIGEGQAFPAAIVWRVRLESDPAAALELIREAAQESDLSQELRLQLAMEAAAIHFARGDYASALAPLAALTDASGKRLPGEFHVLKGLASWGLGQIQNAREALASVPQADPAFGWARYYLGRIGLAQGNVELALRYFESASRGDLAGRIPALLAGSWEGLRLSGRSEAAQDVQDELLRAYPHSLALLQVNHGLVTEQILAEAAPAADPAVQEPPTPQLPAEVGFSLQLAAFSDRGRALAYLAQHRAALADLSIVEELTDSGKLLYKVRHGSYARRDLAATEAERIARAHDLQALIVESGP